VGDAAIDPIFIQSQNIQKGALWDYNKSMGVYKCPSDLTVIYQTKTARVRSYSLSAGWGWADGVQSANANPPLGSGSNKSLGKLSQATGELRLDNLAVFLDEQASDNLDPANSPAGENSIDNGAIGMYSSAKSPVGQYWNVPGARHNRGCVISFGDGHAEYWKWVDPWIATARKHTASPGGVNDRDLQRVGTIVPF
jgi:prepilin-type processing-associated H-X9-DG protein